MRLFRLAILSFSITCVSIAAGFSQDTIPSLSAKPKRPDDFWRRIAVGGNVGLQFGSVTGITISPEVRIRAIDHLYFGIGFIYQYLRYKNYYWDKPNNEYIDFQSNVFGGRIYSRYYLRSLFNNALGNIFAHVEYEYLFYSVPFSYDPNGTIFDPNWNPFSPGKTSIEVNSFFVGAGYSQPVGGRTFIDFLILFNLNDSYNSPYTNPIFRLGVGVGL